MHWTADGRIQLLEDDEIMIVEPEIKKDLIRQKELRMSKQLQSKPEEPSENNGRPVSAWRRFVSLLSPRRPRHCEDYVFAEADSPRLTALVIHPIGQPLPKVYTEKVPPSTLLIAVNGEDFLEHNIFEARSVTLEYLKKASESAAPNDNKQGDEAI